MTFAAGGSQRPPAFLQSLDPFDPKTRAASALTSFENKNHETDKTHGNLTP